MSFTVSFEVQTRCQLTMYKALVCSVYVIVLKNASLKRILQKATYTMGIVPANPVKAAEAQSTTLAVNQGSDGMGCLRIKN